MPVTLFISHIPVIFKKLWHVYYIIYIIYMRNWTFLFTFHNWGSVERDDIIRFKKTGLSNDCDFIFRGMPASHLCYISQHLVHGR